MYQELPHKPCTHRLLEYEATSKDASFLEKHLPLPKAFWHYRGENWSKRSARASELKKNEILLPHYDIVSFKILEFRGTLILVAPQCPNSKINSRHTGSLYSFKVEFKIFVLQEDENELQGSPAKEPNLDAFVKSKLGKLNNQK